MTIDARPHLARSVGHSPTVCMWESEKKRRGAPDKGGEEEEEKHETHAIEIQHSPACLPVGAHRCRRASFQNLQSTVMCLSVIVGGGGEEKKGLSLPEYIA